MDFFQTKMGSKFYNADVPRLIKALETIAEELQTKTRYDVITSGALSEAFEEGWEYVDVLPDGWIVVKRKERKIEG